MSLSTRKKGSEIVNVYCSMNPKEKFHCVGLIIILWRSKKIIQQLIRGNHCCLCHTSQCISVVLVTKKKLRWPPKTWLNSPFENQDICHDNGYYIEPQSRYTTRKEVLVCITFMGFSRKSSSNFTLTHMCRSIMCELLQYSSWKTWCRFDSKIFLDQYDYNQNFTHKTVVFIWLNYESLKCGSFPLSKGHVFFSVFASFWRHFLFSFLEKQHSKLFYWKNDVYPSNQVCSIDLPYQEFVKTASLYMWDPKYFELIMGNVAPNLKSNNGIYALLADSK